MNIIKSNFPSLTNSQLLQFESLTKLYDNWNNKINVISRKDISELNTRHVLHSLSIAKVIDFKSKSKILDVGTGGGFPGIPLAIIQPKNKFILVESKKKKAQFILEASQALGLDNVLVIGKRSEEVGPKHSADAIVSRALGSLNYFIEKTKHLLAKNGNLYAMKGKNPEEEINSLIKGWAVAQIKKIDVPYLDAERHIITITRKK